MNDQDAAARQLLELYADALECANGPCLAGRAALMNWLDDQFSRVARLQVPDQAAHDMIRGGYVEWLADGFPLPTAPGRLQARPAAG